MHDVRHTGRSPYVSSVNPGVVRWTQRVGSAYTSPVIAADGTVYGSDGSTLVAFCPDGSVRWRYETDKLIDTTPALAADGTIYHASLDDYLHAISPDGLLKWRYQMADLFSNPAVGSDGTIYVGCTDKYVYAVHPNGTLKWRYKTNGTIYSSPAIGADGTIYIGSYDHHLYAINPDGSLRWRFETGAEVRPEPAIGDDGTIYVGSWDFNMYAVNPDGTEQWRFETGSYIQTCPAIGRDGTLYFGSYDGNFYAVNPDGSLKWRQDFDGQGVPFLSSAAVGGDGTVYVGAGTKADGDIDARLYAFTLGGSVAWVSEQLSDFRVYASPTIARDGTIYVGASYMNATSSYYAIGGGCIERPVGEMLYVNDRAVTPLPVDLSIVIGALTVEPFLQDVERLTRVSFLVDGEEQWSTTEYPCTWRLAGRLWGLHVLEVRGYYDTGDVVRQQLRLLAASSGSF
ncbi:MAG: PQQ-binding-like beta-propeller repeat protein [Candidatus Thermoplasmatota archaeon]|nr:PQQ-binding-like beta-propeller repeat protein [Candidatus Thermoplasmatota archaeon]